MVKELLKNNLNAISGLSIKFKRDEFIVVDKDKNVIFRDLIKNYDTTFKSQKDFILKVANRFTSFINVLEDIKDKKQYFKDLIIVDNKYYFNVIGRGDIYKSATYIDIDMEVLKEDFKEKYKDNEPFKESLKYFGNNFLKFCKDDYKEFINDTIDCYKEAIENNFEGVRIVLYNNMYNNIGFFVSAVRYENEININYYNNYSEKVYNTITLYYSLIEDEKEVKKAIEFIRDLINY